MKMTDKGLWCSSFSRGLLLLLIFAHCITPSLQDSKSPLDEASTQEVFSSSTLITWFAPFYSGGGYSSEAISFLQALHKLGISNFTISQHGDSYNSQFLQGQSEEIKALLTRSVSPSYTSSLTVTIFQATLIHPRCCG